MKSYDNPYSNVGKKRYPTMLVHTSLNDSQSDIGKGRSGWPSLRANKTEQ